MTGKTASRSITFFFLPLLLLSSPVGAGSSAGRVIVSTESSKKGPSSAETAETDDCPPKKGQNPEAFQKKIREDGHKAAALLRKTVCDKSPLSVWAAVYLRRLEIHHDEACAQAALLRGISADDPLLQALCWRHLAAAPRISLPKWRDKRKRDPTVRALAAIAYAVRGRVPKPLRSALSLPAGPPRGKNRKAAVEKRTNHLGALSAPFDDGPVAIAAAFVEMREQECAIAGGKKRQHAAGALRNTLLKCLVENPEPVSAKLPTDPANSGGMGAIASRLDNRLVTRSRDTLRAIALTGTPALRVEGLRAIAVVTETPVAGDLAAAAAALSAKNPTLRLEGARTFLLLLKRVH